MPTITSLVSSVDSQQNLTVNISWDSADTGTVAILDAGSSPVNGTVTASGPGWTTWQPASGAMQAGQPYWAQVIVAQVPSLKVPLLWTAPSAVATRYDGTTIAVSWTAPAGFPTPGSYVVMIAGGGVTESITVTGTVAEIIALPSLPANTNWSVSVQPSLNVAQGPSASGTVLTTATAVTAVTCSSNGDGTGVLVITPGQTSYTQFVATLSQNNVPVLSSTLSYGGQPMTLQIPSGNWPLSAAGGYSIALQGSSTSNATGPAGPALAVLVTAPFIVLAQLDSGVTNTVSINIVPPPGVPVPSGFAVRVNQGSTTVGNGNFNGSSATVTLNSSYSAGAATVLTVWSMIGSNSTGPSSSLTLLTQASTLASLDFDAGILNAGWTAVSGAGAYQFTVMNGSSAISQIVVSATGASVPLPAVPYSVTVRTQSVSGGTIVLGPMATPVAGLHSATQALGVRFSLGGVATFSWLQNTDPGVSGYTVNTFDGALPTGTAVTVTGAGTLSTPLPAASIIVGANGLAQLRATGTDAATNCALAGPRSALLPILSNPATQLTASYDGATAQLNWAPPAGSAVDGYQVTLTDSSGTVATVVTRTPVASLSLPYAAQSSSVVSVAVQATGGNAVGAAVSTPLLQPGLFLSTASTNAPYLWPSASLQFGAQALGILLPGVLSSPQSTLPSNASFTLTTATQAPWAYLLTVNTASPAWTFDGNAIRPGVQSDITDFLSKMSDQGLTAQGDLQLRQAFARVLPLTFVETLYYGYGFNVADDGTGANLGQVDITPGLVLRVEFESYETLPASLQAQNAGMVGASVAWYDINSYRSGTTWRQGFDAFLSRLVGHGTTFPGPNGGVTSPTQTGAGGSPDLYYTNFLQAYYRLLYPVNFLKSYDPSVSNNLRDNVTLIAAATRADLDAATNVLRNPGVSYQPVNAVYFRGRALVSPNIYVTLNQQPLTVPMGTSVANLLERFARRNLSGQGPAGVTLQRGLAGVGVNGWAASRQVAVRLDWAGGFVYDSGSDWLDLPLLHGDSVNVALD